ncbi:MAG: 4Fe-4S binding protein [candidate division WOR-3 bacterium]|uniref:4Fe-4S ferredoxin n=1 Tax=candidate division WOR-3 bacterium TaxID=2052148 RepID=A0A7C1SWR0_UNCW3|nr:4Fe-4S binding protein [candidate division WOR-3 bacterium]
MTVEKYRRSGVLTFNDLKRNGLIPSYSRLQKRPVVLIECIENIPCNPCAYACPRGAIKIEGALINKPRVDFEVCNGCGICITKCPGLAIFVIDFNYTKTHVSIAMPYEFIPRPQPDAKVLCLDRNGNKVCYGRVVKLLDSQRFNRCAVVTVAVPKRFWKDVRHIRLI